MNSYKLRITKKSKKKRTRHVYKLKRNCIHRPIGPIVAELLGSSIALTMVSVVYRSALFFVAIFLVNIQTSQCLLNGSLGRRPLSSSESNREEQSKTLKNNGRGHRQSSQSERTLSIHGLDRSTEKAQEAERQEGGNTVGRDRNNRISRNLGSDTRRQSERGTASMQTSVNERNNH